MKKLLRGIANNLGILPYIHVLREKYFPSKYYLDSQSRDDQYIQFYAQFINKGDLCFDIGAHKGHRTNIFLKSGARVMAVEPQKDLFKYLKFKYGKKISLENCGLGAEPGVQEMFINDSSSLSTFSKEWAAEAETGRFSDTKFVDKKTIEIKTLDLMISKYGVPKFCKIDVETYEFEVLKGLHQKIPFISFEFMLPESFTIAKNCIDYLLQLNPQAEVNYSIGDDLKLVLPEWIGLHEIDKFFNEAIFKTSSWGDIYVRMN